MDTIGHYFIQPLDWGKSFAFYTEVLGFRVKHQDGSASDASRLAILAHGETFELVLAEDHDPSAPSGKPPVFQARGRVALHFNTPDVDAAFARIRDGAHVKVRPENNHWGTRWFLVEDPDGHHYGWQGPRT